MLKKRMSPTNVIIFGFLAIILVGTLLLVMPFSSSSGEFTDPLTALFTATSATCVTGLITVDTGIYWSAFGKSVIILLIQVGGLGFMSLAMVFSALLKRRVSPRERVLFTQSMNLDPASDLASFAYRVTVFAFSAEGLGALLLSFRFVPEFGFLKGICFSVFHSVSAFCNAGFDILGNEFGEFASISAYADDVYVNIVLILLIVSGGLGFIVWDDIRQFIKKHDRIALYSKLVLVLSAVLILGGALFIALVEWNNAEVLGNGSAGTKIIRALFQSVTLRTAGFATVDQASLSDGTKLFSMILMFIGGSSGSTAGGIKTGTVAIVLVATLAIIRGERDSNFEKRRIPSDTVRRAFALFVIGLFVVLVSGFALYISEGVPLNDAFFEVFSAFGTVGITVGITPSLSVFGRLLIIGLMFFGRIGIVSIMYAIMVRTNREKPPISYPVSAMPVG
ncbi:MAG: Trk family potassium uptake protein [Clostridia bacterium]|nr:Trk family potassium uptake protein [Clostridia bacterium]